jgi:DNA-binding MarR family transcriptional regulator
MAELTDAVLRSLRRIIRATSLHSRRLGKETGLTTPQVVVLREVERHPDCSVSEVAREISLSQATVTTLLNGLEDRQLIKRTKNDHDKRRTDISLSAKGARFVQEAPLPLQENFVERFARLATWEQYAIVAALERVASMMDADGLDAAPMLDSAADLGPQSAIDPG